MDAREDVLATRCARAVLKPVALINRGRGEGRALAAPVARLQKEKQAAVTTGLAENARPSPRNGFNGCFAFSLVRRLAGHHHGRDTLKASPPA
uniref:hypothetical protein n=1 Tax=Bradyrhizobium sp. (strain ORS 278) TaxID=114615 RepID=UPI001FCAD3D9|nr:hypothetical protein [Bradyrhizobium sp. ORS 278]